MFVATGNSQSPSTSRPRPSMCPRRGDADLHGLLLTQTFVQTQRAAIAVGWDGGALEGPLPDV